MAQYTQSERHLRASTALGENALLLESFSGEEGVSMPFAFTLNLLSENASIDPAGLLRKPITVAMDMADGSTRTIHGLVRRFAQLGRAEGLTHYRAEMVPWLWFLTQSSDCRIFQNQTVVEISETVFSELGYSDYQVKCLQSYPKREYCVQYREAHFDFLSRLWEEEGIFYFFEHSKEKHTLVLADHTSAAKNVNGVQKVRMVPTTGGWVEEEWVTELHREHSAGSGKVTVRQYDPLKPSTLLEGKYSGDGQGELYDYHEKFIARAEGDRYARLRLEEREALLQVVRGTSTVRGLQCGAKFDLADHYRPDANRSYHVLRVRHSGRVDGFRAGGEGGFDYSNDFVAIPDDVPFRPPLSTPKPVVRGSQTAVVVGPGGEEIWVDKYGRVKVQFHWDRRGKKDDKSSCWVRVSTLWAGKQWGFVQIPRIGQEVIVDFLEGDPDQPIITGRVYNAEQMPPYALPANQTQSGWKSRSTKGGGEENFNEIRFEDMKGSEELYIHAEKDETHEVENDRDDSVGRDERVKIGRDERIGIGRDRTETVGRDETITIDGKRTENVSKTESITIGESRTESVGKNETIEISENRSERVGKNEKVEVGESREVKVGKDDELKVEKKLAIIAGDQIQLQTGDASIIMKKDGTITIKGKDIKITGTGKINLKADSDITFKGSTVKQD